MKKLLLTTALMLVVQPAFAKEVIVKEVTDKSGKAYFLPDKLTIEPGDTVTFVNAQDEMHEVMFVSVPKGVDEMIMSPMHEKKGDKFSYTFTVPGTYQFHCHPHESVGMKGTLIVGKASKPGETKDMDHHKMAKKLEETENAAKTKPAASELHQGVGTINTIDAIKHTVNITHDPIKSLNWPKMKMLFTVDSSVDLSGYQVGDKVSFTLKPQGKDDLVITNIKKSQ